MSETLQKLPLPSVTVDRQALELVALYVVVLGVTAAIAAYIGPEEAATVSPPEQFGEGTQAEAGAATAMVLVEVAFAVGLLGLILVYNRLPEFAQDLVKSNAYIGVFVYLGARYGTQGQPWELPLLVVGVYTAYRVLDRYGLYWMLNNVFAVGLAIVMGVAVGLIFGIPGVGLLLLGLTVYDHVFANKQQWMFTMGKTLVKIGVPVLFLRPSALRNEWDDIVAMFDDSEGDGDDDGESEDTVTWGLGTGDMMLPAGFVTAVITTPSDALLVGGLVAGVVCILGALLACLRLRYEMLTRGSGAGLPALSTGLLAAYGGVLVAGLLGLA